MQDAEESIGDLGDPALPRGGLARHPSSARHDGVGHPSGRRRRAERRVCDTGRLLDGVRDSLCARWRAGALRRRRRRGPVSGWATSDSITAKGAWPCCSSRRTTGGGASAPPFSSPRRAGHEIRGRPTWSVTYRTRVPRSGSPSDPAGRVPRRSSWPRTGSSSAAGSRRSPSPRRAPQCPDGSDPVHDAAAGTRPCGRHRSR